MVPVLTVSVYKPLVYLLRSGQKSGDSNPIDVTLFNLANEILRNKRDTWLGQADQKKAYP